MVHVTLAAITESTILVPYLQVRSLQLIWRLGTRRFHLRVPNLQKSCRDFTFAHMCHKAKTYRYIYPL